MKVYTSFSDLAKDINKPPTKVEEAWINSSEDSFFLIDDIRIEVQSVNDKLTFVIYDSNNDDDCYLYIMQFEQHKYDWKVYVDHIEKWQPCNVLSISNSKMSIDRAVIETPNETQLNRLVKIVKSEEDIQPTGCIYLIKKVA